MRIHPRRGCKAAPLHGARRVLHDARRRPPRSSCRGLHNAAPRCTTLHDAAPRCTTLHHVARRCTTLHDAARRCTTLHHVARATSASHPKRGGRQARPAGFSLQLCGIREASFWKQASRRPHVQLESGSFLHLHDKAGDGCKRVKFVQLRRPRGVCNPHNSKSQS